METFINRTQTGTDPEYKQSIQCFARYGDKAARLGTRLDTVFEKAGHFVFGIGARNRNAVDAGKSLGDALGDDVDQIGKRRRADHSYFYLAKAGPDALVIAQLLAKPDR